jgi:hypothetical protein
LFGVGCGSDAESPTGPGKVQCASYNPLRDPFFGDTHVHTNLSLDANLNGTRPGPDEAYAFARDGTEIGLQPYDADGNPSRTAQLARPVDFVMLSDHAEFMGTVSVCQDPSSEPYDDPDCVLFREDPDSAFFRLNAGLSNPPQSASYPALCGDGGQACIEAGMDVWGSVQASAEAAYDRGVRAPDPGTSTETSSSGTKTFRKRRSATSTRRTSNSSGTRCTPTA